METKNNKNSPLTKALVATALVLAAALIAVTLLGLPSLLEGTPAPTQPVKMIQAATHRAMYARMHTNASTGNLGRTSTRL